MPKSVTVCGTWDSTVASQISDTLYEVGTCIAKHSLTLKSGAGEGASKFIVEAYRENGGLRYQAFLPSLETLQKSGEQIGPEPDETIIIEGTYPHRNLELVRNSELLLVTSGRLGTLQEIIFAVNDFAVPTLVMDNIGDIATYVRAIDLLKNRVTLVRDIHHLDTLLGEYCHQNSV